MGNGRNRRLNNDEEQRLFSACDQLSNPMLGWIVRLALATAMRHGEIVNLIEQQISFERKTILLTDTKNSETRTVPLSNKAIEALKQAVNNPFRPKDSKLIFCGEPGKDGIRRPYVTNRVWRAALSIANIEGLRFHDLRHEATSRFVEAGLSDQEVSSITGHKSMQMLKRYTHLRSENLATKIANL